MKSLLQSNIILCLLILLISFGSFVNIYGFSDALWNYENQLLFLCTIICTYSLLKKYTEATPMFTKRIVRSCIVAFIYYLVIELLCMPESLSLLNRFRYISCVCFPFLLLVAMIKLGSKNSFNELKRIFEVAYVIFAIIYIYAHITRPWAMWNLDDEIVTTYNNSIYYIVFLLPIAMNSKYKWWHITLAFICVLLSTKRGSFIAFSGGIFAMIMVNGVKEKKNVIKYLIPLAVILVTYQYISTIYDIEIFDRLKTIADDEGSGRVDIYKQIWNKFSESSVINILLGHGGLLSTVYVTGDNAAHNDILEILYDFGCIGLFFYLNFYLSLLRVFRMSYEKQSSSCGPFAYSIVAFTISMLVSNVVFVLQYFLLLIVSWGVIIPNLYNYESSNNSAK